MKPYILISIIALALASCANPNKATITFDDEKTEAVRQHFQDYLNNDIEAMTMRWSKDLEVTGSTIEGVVGVEEAKQVIGLHHILFSDITITSPDSDDNFYAETTYYPDSGETWTKTWYTWSATGKYTGNEVSNISMTGLRWEDGKIVEEMHFGDGSLVETEVFAYQLMQAKEQ